MTEEGYIVLLLSFFITALWEFVATPWQNAIDYMKQVQPSDPNYNIAQDRVVLYQKNIEYARLAASQAQE